MLDVDSNAVARGFSDAIVAELRAARRKIVHCVEQLSDEQLWSRSAPEMNSIANLLLHLDGNLRQWIVAGLAGTLDHRDRPREFSERGPISREELVARVRRAYCSTD